MNNTKILKKAIDVWGIDAQTGIAMEESAELIQAVSKCRRYGCKDEHRDNLIEEIADVLICIEQLRLIYGISDDEVCEVQNRKLAKLSKRLNDKH